MKMLATGAVFADEVLDRQPHRHRRQAPKREHHRALPINTPGVSFWAREPYERHARHEADYPRQLPVRRDRHACWSATASRFRGSGCSCTTMRAMSRRIYIETPANCYQNHQSNVRFWAKMGLIVGLASRMCQANGVDKIPAVRETLGRLAALEATDRRSRERADRGLRAMARRLCHAQPSDHVCDAQLVPGASHRNHRRAAHACARGAAADAGEHRPRRRPRAQGTLRALVDDALAPRGRASTSSTSSPGT